MTSKSKSKSNPFAESLQEDEEILWLSVYRPGASLSRRAHQIAGVYLGSLVVGLIFLMITRHMNAFLGLGVMFVFLTSPIAFALLFDAWRAPHRPPSEAFAVTPQRLLYGKQDVTRGFSQAPMQVHGFPMENITAVSMPNPDGGLTKPIFSSYYPKWMSEDDGWQADEVIAQARVQRFQAVGRRLTSRKLPRDRSAVRPYSVSLESVLFPSEVILWQTTPISLVRAIGKRLWSLVTMIPTIIIVFAFLGLIQVIKWDRPEPVTAKVLIFLGLSGAGIGVVFLAFMVVVVLGHFLLTLGRVHWQRDRHMYAITNERILFSRLGAVRGAFLDELPEPDETEPVLYGETWMTDEDFQQVQTAVQEALKQRFQSHQGG